ncbi:MAG: ABC transporter ATP-binding protein, partial [Methanothrix sp.]|nr:ABC transporter ATP-binding protein [Methanothrix sp.]
MSILQIEGLSVCFDTIKGAVRAAQDVSLDLEEEETLAMVGETGCGKSVVANAILQLLPGNARVQGRIVYRGRDLLQLCEKDLSQIRGREISIVFQNPSLALNPVYRIAEQAAEPLLISKASRESARKVARNLLARLGLAGFEDMYPFQLSGGMNQRAMITCSAVLNPKVIIADEPTKGLDQELVRDVLEEIRKVKEANGSSLLLITHDLGVAKSISNRVAIMYCGDVVELGETEKVLQNPLHPYARALLDSLPERGFKPIPGPSPSMINPPEGCKFHPRCPFRLKICSSQRPELSLHEDGAVRCWLWV